ncbi:hypothetical protein NM208_g12658 [Fusarium decemcellulare]|uniref:Uncharacterized protein n=1 Tax=Fusarium decemcellulare TaxID=57161 RepID=A0ACC1RP14_9HYPO|nr:hypothetical protein NM208_g12658 [Fusarium decemcellulare]
MASLSPEFNATVIDPVTGTSTPAQHILAQNGTITAVVSDESALPSQVSEATTIDVSGKYICPGLIDGHVHISAAPSDTDFSKVKSTPEHMSMLHMTYVCRSILVRSFTTVRDCDGALYALSRPEEWLVPGPRLFISGHAPSQTGGHGGFRNCHGHTHCASGFVSGFGRACNGVPACLATTARDEIRRGANFIKSMGSGSNHGTYMTCHAYAPDSIRVVMENGVKGIEYGNLIDEPTAKLMLLNEDSQIKNRKVLYMGINTLKIAKEAGLTLCYGSDQLGPLGLYQTREFSIRSEGLSNIDILQSATINLARMIGETSTLVQAKTGSKADLLILNNNPLDDTTAFERQEEEVVAVIKDGRARSSLLVFWTFHPPSLTVSAIPSSSESTIVSGRILDVLADDYGAQKADADRPPYVPAMDILRADKESKTWLRFFHSTQCGPDLSRSFCARCGTQLCFHFKLAAEYCFEGKLPDDWQDFFHLYHGSLDREFLEKDWFAPHSEVNFKYGTPFTKSASATAKGLKCLHKLQGFDEDVTEEELAKLSS